MDATAVAGLARRAVRVGWTALRVSAQCVWTGLGAVGAAGSIVAIRQPEQDDGGDSASGHIGPCDGHPEHVPPPWPRSDAEHWLRAQLEEIDAGRRRSGRGAARRRPNG